MVTKAAGGTNADRRTARERLLDAATELFYAEGVHTVGIDRIIERAGVAKASLYNAFGSKDELVRAYLQDRHNVTADRIIRAIDALDSPREQLLAIFAVQGKRIASPDYRGCAFVNASAEAQPGSVVEQESDAYRGWIRDTFTRLAGEAGAADPTGLAAQLVMVYDGANTAARMDRNRAAGTTARATAEILLDAALAT